MRKGPLYLMLIAALAFEPSAEAKNRDKSWEFGAFVSHLDADRTAGIDNGVGGGIRIGYHFSAKIEADLYISKTSTSHSNFPDFMALALRNVPPDPDPNYEFLRIATIEPETSDDDDFLRTVLEVTGNFLTDRETRTIPYITAGLGIIQETRDSFPFTVDYMFQDPNLSMADPNKFITVQKEREVLESFDASAILSLGFGARTFFSDNWGIRYELRYNHHDSFQVNQDEYVVGVEATWIVGGKK